MGSMSQTLNAAGSRFVAAVLSLLLHAAPWLR